MPANPDTDTTPVAAVGIDGCRAGWIAAFAFGEVPALERTGLCLFYDIRGVVDWHSKQPLGPKVAVDVPMGLPPRVGLRKCDRQARGRLGRRWMCVFEPPDRELFGHDFDSARSLVYARRADDPKASFRVLTQQGAHIMKKIAEVDAVLCEQSSQQEWLIEVHPEVSFRELADEDLPRKKFAAGKQRRHELLRGCFPDIDDRLRSVPWRRRDVGYDDMLDAYVALWSALRFARGRGHYVELGDGERDERDLVMRMVV
jgi:predicted RNase H-like nuclease